MRPNRNATLLLARHRLLVHCIFAVLSVLFAAPIGADEGDWEDEPLHQIPLHGPVGLGFRWDRGLIYGIDRPLRVRGRIGATLDVDFGGVFGDAGDVDDGFRAVVRRARFYTQGRLTEFFGPAYRFRFAVEGDRVFLNDFYLRWEPTWRDLERLQVGYFRAPLGLQAGESSSALSLMEDASAVSAFKPGYRLGAQFDGNRARPDFSWQVALTTIGQSDQNGGEDSKSGFRSNARGVWRPWYDATAHRLLHLGASVGYTLSGGQGIRYRARPESFLVDDVVDTGELDSDATVIGVEAAWLRGPLRLQTEAFGSFVTGEQDGNLSGFYLEVGQMLTGESQPYRPETANFGRVKPRAPFSWKKRHWGALELTGRVSWLDLDGGDIRGGRMWTLHLGLVLTCNDYVRLHLDGVYAHPSPDDIGIVQTRVELRF